MPPTCPLHGTDPGREHALASAPSDPLVPSSAPYARAFRVLAAAHVCASCSMVLRLVVDLGLRGFRSNKRTPIKQKDSDWRLALRRHSTDNHSTDNKQAQECAACACMLLHCCAALMHRADACAALPLLLLPVCCGACSRRPPCIIRVARRRLATQMCLCRGCCQTWRWHLRPCAHRHTADTRPRTRDTRA